MFDYYDQQGFELSASKVNHLFSFFTKRTGSVDFDQFVDFLEESCGVEVDAYEYAGDLVN